ncbi:uncharacterized protein LOC141912305 [Tubulanus polymorphus]|uniref:uncharacterized protein LOC141912305 n=1 Tax=Tubulanus polymorphus TaxID=672921 RepID=UPI003DA56C95
MEDIEEQGGQQQQQWQARMLLSPPPPVFFRSQEDESILMPPPKDPNDCLITSSNSLTGCSGDWSDPAFSDSINQQPQKRFKNLTTAERTEPNSGSNQFSNQDTSSGRSEMEKSDIPPEGAAAESTPPNADDHFIPFDDLIKNLNSETSSIRNMYLQHFNSSVTTEQQCEAALDEIIECALNYERDLIEQKERLLARLGRLQQLLKPEGATGITLEGATSSLHQQ